MSDPTILEITGDVADGYGKVTHVTLSDGTAVVVTPALTKYAESALTCFLDHPELQNHLVSNSHRGEPFVTRVFRDVKATVEVPAPLWRQLVSNNTNERER